MDLPSWKILVNATLIIFAIVEETLSKQIWLPSENTKTPLAMIGKRDGTLWLAEPQKYGKDYVAYVYDDSRDENGIEEKFFVACPIRGNFPSLLAVEKNLKINDKLSKESKLLIAKEYTINKSICGTYLAPSIEKLEKKDDNGNAQYCGRSEAEMYQAGYPVIKMDDWTDMKFTSIYQICLSTAKGVGVLYAIHRIVSPKVLLQKLWDFYEHDPKASIQISLNADETYIGTESVYKNHYAYQFVGIDDMPTRSWELATSFSINFTAILKNEDLMMGMITADNYIRLFSRETNKPLTLYSGPHRKIINVAPPPPPPPPPEACLETSCEPMPTQINSFWRLIIDDEGYALVMVTQHTPIKCDIQEDTYICHENRVVVQQYEKGGCTYTCSANNEIIKLLSLPAELKITGVLALAFPQKIPTGPTKSSQQRQSSVVKSPKEITIFDFMGKESFFSVLTHVDADLAENVRFQKSKLRS